MFDRAFGFRKTSGRTPVLLTNVGSQKEKIIRIVSRITGLNLNQSAELVSKTPVVIKKNLTLAEAQKVSSELTAAGAAVTLRTLN